MDSICQSLCSASNGQGDFLHQLNIETTLGKMLMTSQTKNTPNDHLVVFSTEAAINMSNSQ